MEDGCVDDDDDDDDVELRSLLSVYDDKSGTSVGEIKRFSATKIHKETKPPIHIIESTKYLAKQVWLALLVYAEKKLSDQ